MHERKKFNETTKKTTTQQSTDTHRESETSERAKTTLFDRLKQITRKLRVLSLYVCLCVGMCMSTLCCRFFKQFHERLSLKGIPCCVRVRPCVYVQKMN